MNKIINLTQHSFTIDQLQDIESKGLDVVEIDQSFKSLLNFETLPETHIVRGRADDLSLIAEEAGASFAMIGGAPYLMAPLEESLFRRGIKPLYAFSVRSSIERTKEDGTVEKLSIFKHLGFIEPRDSHRDSYENGKYEGYENGYHDGKRNR